MRISSMGIFLLFIEEPPSLPGLGGLVNMSVPPHIAMAGGALPPVQPGQIMPVSQANSSADPAAGMPLPGQLPPGMQLMMPGQPQPSLQGTVQLQGMAQLLGTA